MRHDGAGQPAGLKLGPLPEFAPAIDLWPRVLATRQRRLRVRRRRQVGLAAALAIAVITAVAWLPRPTATMQQELVAGQHESQRLEAQWRRLDRARVAGASGLTRLRVIDASLQAAYDRGAGSRELVPLWRKRNEALRGLIAQSHDAQPDAAASITRI